MRLLICVIPSLLAFAALAEEPVTPKRVRSPDFGEMQKVRALELRANALRPRRRDTPLRELNLTDGEVREIQAVASRYAMNSMLNISPVIAGCACEEGPLCTDQVYVVATTADQTTGLQLSRLRNAWTVGPVQAWWFRFDELAKRAPKMDMSEFFDAKAALLHEFPMCVGSDPEPGATTAQTK